MNFSKTILAIGMGFYSSWAMANESVTCIVGLASFKQYMNMSNEIGKKNSSYKELKMSKKEGGSVGGLLEGEVEVVLSGQPLHKIGLSLSQRTI